MTDATENIKCFVRCRPLNDKEKGLGVKCINILSDDKTIQVENKSDNKNDMRQVQYTMDHVFDEDVTQESLFSQIGMPIITSFLKGFNCTIFCYGQTGAGKTHTMMGPLEALYENTSPVHGLIPRILDFLFNESDKVNEIIAGDKGIDVKKEIKTCCMEIYQENIIDLLSVPAESNTSGGKGSSSTVQTTVANPDKLKIKEDPKRGMYIDGITEAPIHTSKEAKDIILKGLKSRHVAATAMNAESSRSHLIFTIYLRATYRKPNGGVVSKTSRLHLIDLAGSERQNKTKAEGTRVKEAGMINKSLSSLGNVINALVENSEGKNKYVPFRDSKLTHFLKDSLGGNSKTTIVANISLSIIQINETISTLKFVQRAKMIKNKAVANEAVEESAAVLHAEIKRLKAIIEEFKAKEKKADQAPSEEPSSIIVVEHPDEGPEADEVIKGNERPEVKFDVNAFKSELEKLIETISKNFGKETEIKSIFTDLDNELKGAGTGFMKDIEKYKEDNAKSISELSDVLGKFNNVLKFNRSDIDEIKSKILNEKGVVNRTIAKKIDLIAEAITELKKKIDNFDIEEYFKLKNENTSLINENASLSKVKEILETEEKRKEIEKNQINPSEEKIGNIVKDFSNSNNQIKDFFTKYFLNNSAFQDDLILLERSQFDKLKFQVGEAKMNERSLNKRIDELENENFLLSLDIVRLRQQEKEDKEKLQRLSVDGIKHEEEEKKDEEEEKLSVVESVPSSSSGDEESEEEFQVRKRQATTRSRRALFRPSDNAIEPDAFGTNTNANTKEPVLTKADVEVLKLKEQLDETEEQLSDKNNEINELNQKIYELNQKVDEQNRKVEKFELNNQQLKEEIDTLNMTNDIFEKNIFSLNQEKKEVMNEVEEILNQINKNNEDLSKLFADESSLLSKIAPRVVQYLEKKQKISNLGLNYTNFTLSNIVNQLSTTNASVKEMSNIFDYVTLSYKHRADDLMMKLLETKNQIEIGRDEIKVNKANISELNEEIKKNNEEINNLIKEKNKLIEEKMEKDSQINILKNTIEGNQKTIEDLNKNAISITDELNEKKTKISELTTEKLELKNQASVQSNEISNLNLSIDEKDSLIKSLQSEVKIANDKLSKLKEKEAYFLKKLKEKNSGNTQLQVEMQTSKKTIAELKDKITSLNDVISSKEKLITDINNEKNKLCIDINDLKKEIESLKQELSNKSVSLSSVEKDKENLNQKLDSHSSNQTDEIINRDKKIGELNRSLSSMNAKYNLFKDKINSLLQDMTNSEITSTNLKEENIQLKSQVMLYKTQIEYLLTKTGNDYSELVKQNDTLIEEKSSLEEEFEGLSVRCKISELVMNISKEVVKDYANFISENSETIKAKEIGDSVDLFIEEKVKKCKSEIANSKKEIDASHNEKNSLNKELSALLEKYYNCIRIYLWNPVEKYSFSEEEENTPKKLLKLAEVARQISFISKQEIKNILSNCDIYFSIGDVSNCNLCVEKLTSYLNDYDYLIKTVSKASKEITTNEDASTAKEVNQIVSFIISEKMYYQDQLGTVKQREKKDTVVLLSQIYTKIIQLLSDSIHQYENIQASIEYKEKLTAYYSSLLSEVLEKIKTNKNELQSSLQAIQKKIISNAPSSTLTKDDSIELIEINNRLSSLNNEKIEALKSSLGKLISAEEESKSEFQLQFSANTNIINEIVKEIELKNDEVTSKIKDILKMEQRYIVIQALPSQFETARPLITHKDIERKNELLVEKLKLILGKNFNPETIYNETPINVFWNTASIPKLSKQVMILKETKMKIENDIALLNSSFNQSLTDNATDSKIRMLYIIKEENKQLKNEIKELKGLNKNLELRIQQIAEVGDVFNNYNTLLDMIVPIGNENKSDHDRFTCAINLLRKKANGSQQMNGGV